MEFVLDVASWSNSHEAILKPTPSQPFLTNLSKSFHHDTKNGQSIFQKMKEDCLSTTQAHATTTEMEEIQSIGK